jgi:hypothetical protein
VLLWQRLATREESRLLTEIAHVAGEVLQLVERTALEKGLRGARLTTDAKQVEVGLTDKSDAMDWLIRELARGLKVAPEHMLIAGDEFGQIAGLEGSDHKMVTHQAKAALFISVGAEPWGTPPEVMHLGGGPARFRALLAHQAALLERLHRPLTSGVVPRADRRNPAGPLPSAPPPLRSLPV